MTLRIIATAVATGLALTLTACTDDTPTGGDATESPMPGGAATAQPTPSEPETPTFSSPQECLVGTWLLDNDFWIDAVGQFVSDDDTTFTGLTGTTHLALNADGSYSSTYVSWTIEMEVEGGTGTVERNGVDSGTWSATDSSVEINETTSNSTVTSTFFIGGETMQLQTDGAPGAVDDFTYDCGATILVVTTSEGTFNLTRVS